MEENWFRQSSVGNFCGSLRVQQISFSTLLEQKNLRLDTLTRIRGTVLFYPHSCSPRKAQLSAIGDPPGLVISPIGESKIVRVNAWLPSMWDTSNEAHSVSTHPEHCDKLHDWGAERGQESRQDLEIFKGTQILLTSFADSIKKKNHRWVIEDTASVDHPIWPVNTPIPL